MTALPRSTPEAQGIASSAIRAFVDEIDRRRLGLHSMMLLRHGQVAAEGWWHPYSADYPHMLFSLTKSFTSTAIGLAVSEGRLSIDDTILALFPDEAPSETSANLKAMRVRHLLSMTTGHEQDVTRQTMSAPDKSPVRAFLSLPVQREPGTHFIYNSAASHILSEIIQKLTGQTLLEYLTPRLFEPLGIKPALWEVASDGANTGGWGLSITTEDIARFGQLYLQKGVWNGRQIVPDAWIARATRKQVNNGASPGSDWTQGYGFQFWRCRHGVYRGDGAFGQYCIVMPQHDAVMAMTAGSTDMPGILKAVWDHLLPAMSAAPLPADPRTCDALQRRLAELQLSPAAGFAEQPIVTDIVRRTYRFPANDQKQESMHFAFDGPTLVVRINGTQELRFGHGTWIKQTATLDMSAPQLMAGSYAWTDENTLALHSWLLHTPFAHTLTCRFSGNDMKYQHKVNVAFGPTEQPMLKARASDSSLNRLSHV